MINDLDPSCWFNILIETEIDYTKSIPKKLLKALLNKRIVRFKFSKNYLNKDQGRVVLDFLNSSEANYSSFILQFEDTEYVVEALKAVESRYLFDYGRIETKDPISKEAEQLALKIIESHPCCSTGTIHSSYTL